MAKKRFRRKQERPGQGYDHRLPVLVRCGFRSYQQYLASALWADIRERVMVRSGGKCGVCGLPAKNVHHTSYGDATILGTSLSCLHALCAGCHRRIEFKDGKKRSFASAKAATESYLSPKFRAKMHDKRQRQAQARGPIEALPGIEMSHDERRGVANAVLDFLAQSTANPQESHSNAAEVN